MIYGFKKYTISKRFLTNPVYHSRKSLIFENIHLQNTFIILMILFQTKLSRWLPRYIPSCIIYHEKKINRHSNYYKKCWCRTLRKSFFSPTPCNQVNDSTPLLITVRNKRRSRQNSALFCLISLEIRFKMKALWIFTDFATTSNYMTSGIFGSPLLMAKISMHHKQI